MNNALNIKDPIMIRQLGFSALVKELGGVGAVNFIQQFSNCHGDYVKERQNIYGNISLEKLIADIEMQR